MKNIFGHKVNVVEMQSKLAQLAHSTVLYRLVL